MAELTSSGEADDAAPSLGPRGPFPDTPLTRVLERRWLHYAFVSRDLDLGMVANVASLGSSPGKARRGPFSTAILLLHQRGEGWCASQFNATTGDPLWSAFREPHPWGQRSRLDLASVAGSPRVGLDLWRTSSPSTSQCAPFAGDQHLRWQAETGVAAEGDWTIGGRVLRGLSAVGYHERVRGYWGWPELGGWVFGFANDTGGDPAKPPSAAAVFTFISPTHPAEATTASFMLWRHGRLRRHFPRRRVSMAVRGALDRNRVAQVPHLARLLDVSPMPPIPRRLVIRARAGDAEALLDFEPESAARVVIPSETGLRPFSVHEVVGPCRLEGRIGEDRFGFETRGIVEFAGGAGGD